MFRSVIFTKNRVISKLQVKYFINLLCKRCPVTAVVFKFSYVVLIFMAKILLSTLSKENAVTIFFSCNFSMPQNFYCTLLDAINYFESIAK